MADANMEMEEYETEADAILAINRDIVRNAAGREFETLPKLRLTSAESPTSDRPRRSAMTAMTLWPPHPFVAEAGPIAAGANDYGQVLDSV